MTDEVSSINKSMKITLTGDKDTCSHCKEGDEKLQSHTSAGFDYEYIDVNSDRGQQNLKDYGVKENEHVDIPIIKVESCSWDPVKPQDKKCRSSDWKESYWSDIESGKLPNEVL